MAGLRPFFITGANAKIKLNGKTIAFCTDLSYSVRVDHKAPKVLGMYESTSVEPLGYTVSGSFSVIRYTKDVKSATGTAIDASNAGNGVGNWGTAWDGASGFLSSNGVGNDGRAHEALNPSAFAAGTTFDIQIYQKVGGQRPNQEYSKTISDLSNLAQGGVVQDTAENLFGVANIRNCRIVDSNFSISKRGLAVQRFSFVAIYVDEDSFVADFSGNGQQFQG
jgi:hypothetical protein